MNRSSLTDRVLEEIKLQGYKNYVKNDLDIKALIKSDFEAREVDSVVLIDISDNEENYLMDGENVVKDTENQCDIYAFEPFSNSFE